MPDPSNYDNEDEWMEACVGMAMDEGRDQDQAVAMCMQMWRDRSAGRTTTKAPPPVDRAWSMLEVKSLDNEERTIEGIASTPTVDRIGDVVEPLGAQFSLPMPLLHHHKHDQPIGHVVFAKASKAGISIKAQLAKIAEPGQLKDRVDLAWQEIKAGLVRGLSIGFKPLEYDILEEGNGFRFSKWSWIELSLVTIPANSDCSISVIKSLDQKDLQAASGHDGSVQVGKSRPGVAGKSVATPRRKERGTMKTFSEQIQDLENTRAAKQARMAEIMRDATDDGRSTDGAERDEFDELERDVENIDADLKRFRTLESMNAQQAQPVSDVKTVDNGTAVRANGGAGYVRVQPRKEEPGLRFARVAKAIGIAKGNLSGAVAVAENLYSYDQGVVNVLKAAVAAGTTSDATWASPLVSDEGGVFADFVEFLRPQTIIGKFGANGIPALRRVPFRVPLIRQTTGGDAYWTGEGRAKGLTKFDFSRTTLESLKVANIAVATEELLRDSSPSAEMLIRDQLAAALRARIDQDFIDPTNSGTTGIKPAAITNGVTTTASSGVTGDAVRADIVQLMQGFIDSDNAPTSGVFVMAWSTALSLSLMQNALGQPEFSTVNPTGGTLMGMPIIVSEYVGTSGGSPNTRYVWLVAANDVYLGDDGGVRLDLSREASLVMDSDPNMDSGGTVVSPSAPQAASMVSMFQTKEDGHSKSGRKPSILTKSISRKCTNYQHLDGTIWSSNWIPAKPRPAQLSGYLGRGFGHHFGAPKWHDLRTAALN